MARKIFVSYKHSDDSVQFLEEYEAAEHRGRTARAYVDYLEDLFEGEQIYKGEGDEDLSDFKDETIKTHLKDKIHDSSITVVLISPNMSESSKAESDQWIPWEVSYSLKEVTRGDKKSLANGMVAVVLPNENGDYDYYIQNYVCGCRTLRTGTLFNILSANMFNHTNLRRGNCPHHLPAVYPHSYIQSVKWVDFVDDVNKYFECAKERCDHIAEYNITKEIPD